MIRALVRCLLGLVVIAIPYGARAYDTDESERDVERDIARGEDAFVERLHRGEAKLAGDLKKAMKEEAKRDLKLLRGEAAQGAPEVPRTDDSLQEIEREIDALAPPSVETR
ncbi:MAG: hypothetical protein RL417_4 [Pseudomonadota bacterium]|jgi:hypothetical protein